MGVTLMNFVRSASVVTDEWLARLMTEDILTPRRGVRPDSIGVYSIGVLTPMCVFFGCLRLSAVSHVRDSYIYMAPVAPPSHRHYSSLQ